MAYEKARADLESYGFADRIILTEHNSATVKSAAEAIGCEPAMICKTLSFIVEEKPILILVDGTSKIDNQKFRQTFGCKARMIPSDMVEPMVGHSVGGVCPFGRNPGVEVFLDESLRRHEIVYPAAGNDHSGVRLTIEELETCSGYRNWVDVSK